MAYIIYCIFHTSETSKFFINYISADQYRPIEIILKAERERSLLGRSMRRDGFEQYKLVKFETVVDLAEAQDKILSYHQLTIEYETLYESHSVLAQVLKNRSIESDEKIDIMTNVNKMLYGLM